MLTPLSVFADTGVSRTYRVPFRLAKYGNEEKDSMGSPALDDHVEVDVIGNVFKYKIMSKTMSFELNKKMIEGDIDAMSVYEKDIDSPATKAILEKIEREDEFNQVFIFGRDKAKENRIVINVEVDVPVMRDHPQNAVLVFDWDNAELITGTEPAKSPDVDFSDLTKSHWSYKAVAFCVENEFFKGYPDGTFRPNAPITRGQFVTVLGRIAGVDTAQFKEEKFSDAKPGKWYGPYANWAAENNIADPVSEGMFGPELELNREDMAYILNNYVKTTDLKFFEKGNVEFTDQDEISADRLDSVISLAKKSVVKGMANGSFSPKTGFNRAQIAQVIYNLYYGR